MTAMRGTCFDFLPLMTLHHCSASPQSCGSSSNSLYEAASINRQKSRGILTPELLADDAFATQLEYEARFQLLRLV